MQHFGEIQAVAVGPPGGIGVLVGSAEVESPSTSKSSYSISYSPEEEKQAALNSCTKSDCNVPSAFGLIEATLVKSAETKFIKQVETVRST